MPAAPPLLSPWAPVAKGQVIEIDGTASDKEQPVLVVTTNNVTVS